MLRVLDELPEGLLEAGPENLLKLFGGPALLHLDGQRPGPLFVSVLLHGNEDTGFFAVRALLEKYRDRPPPRALSIFFGNVEAAARGLRRLEGQPDYNRVWPGADTRGTPEHAMMQAICDDLAARGVFAAVDVHNNTGINPHYACVNRLEHRFLRLAALFSRTVVYFTRPRGVASLAFSRLCPAVTVECGKAGQAHGIEHARDYLDTCLHLEEIPVAAVPGHDIDLYHTVVTVKVPEGLSFGFGAGGDVDIDFLPDLDHLNFRELPPGTQLARVRPGREVRLEAWDELGRDIGDDYFEIRDGELRLRRAVMPAMFTLDARIVRQDCLGYLMEQYELIDAEP